MNPLLQKYAHLLANYCLEVEAGDRVLVKSNTLAAPLLKEVEREILKAGGHPYFIVEFEGQEEILAKVGEGDQLKMVNPLYEKAMNEFEGYLYIRAPYNLKASANIDPKKSAAISAATAELTQTYFKRTATREMKRCLCQYPTIASAQQAGMSMEEYEHFVYNACYLFEDDPIESWKKVGRFQQNIVDVLNKKEKIRYFGEGIDVTFSTKDRVWINSDGKTNMPSGEVYTTPVEDSVDGVVHFDYPVVRMGKEIEGVTLWIEDGEVKKWEAKRGQEVLDHVFTIEGAKRFGEAAIGTNTNINQFTKNILFDEKIGGTIHMAIGQSYFQTGGKNQSTIHWDMIANMMNGGAIFADDEKIYENGKFLFS